MAKPLVVLMDGLGCDSSTIGHRWARQTLYPGGRSLHQMLVDDDSQKAIANLQEHLESLPWALYRV